MDMLSDFGVTVDFLKVAFSKSGEPLTRGDS